MKSIKLFIFAFATCACFTNVFAQTNANINIVTANSGIVQQGNSIDLSVSVTNTGSNPINQNKVRPFISIPIAIASALATPSQTGLPAGWIVTSNTGGTITICNGTDIIPAGATRTAIVKIQGTATGGPSTISSTLQFGPGTAICTGLGTLTGDAPGDNTSSTTITVNPLVVPLVLSNFQTTLKDCQPLLSWTTESEINTDRFEIERSTDNGTNWKIAGVVLAKVNSSTVSNYIFTDKGFYISSEKVFYRLKMIDIDGTFKYTINLPLVGNCKTASIMVYPNPVQDDNLYVNLIGTIGNVEATLISSSGQVVLKSKMMNGTNILNVLNLSDGFYILNIKDAKLFAKNIKVTIKH